MNIREAREEDIGYLNAIKNKKMDELFLKRIQEAKEGKSVYLIMEDDNEAVGHVFLKYYGTPNLSDYPNMEDLAVRADKRRLGIGTMLISECERLSKEKGFSKIGLSVNPTLNPHAKEMYEKLGYKHIGNEPYLDGIYDGTEDWVIDMVKEL